jgi:hypothetical protein
MTLQSIRTLRLAFGASSAVAVAYGMAWPLNMITPIFAGLFLSLPTPWFGWKMAGQLLKRLALSLLLGLAISEFLLGYPLICLLIYALLFFFIYYNDTPTAPPMAAMFMTIGITLVPVMGLQGSTGSQIIAAGLFFNMFMGLLFCWLFHTLLPDSLSATSTTQQQKKPEPPPPVPDQERMRLALVSTCVAMMAITLFFSLNLSKYSLAMIYICFMAGSPSTNASIMVMKANSMATGIGGIAAIIVFNLLVAIPTYSFLIAITLLVSLLFSKQIYSGAPLAKAFGSGYTTFLVLLGSSTGVDQVASTNFYLRIFQVLFAGLFCVAALLIVEHLMRPNRRFRIVPRVLRSQ